MSARQRVRVWIASSADGYIATRDGGVAWLDQFNARDPEGLSAAFDTFSSGIGSVVMGRTSYEKALSFGAWPYGDKPVFVVSSRPLTNAPPAVRGAGSDLDQIIRDAKAAAPGDVWVDGGGITIAGLLDQNLVDRIEILVLPILLGDGIRLFARRSGPTINLAAIDSRAGMLGGTWLSLEVNP